MKLKTAIKEAIIDAYFEIQMLEEEKLQQGFAVPDVETMIRMKKAHAKVMKEMGFIEDGENLPDIEEDPYRISFWRRPAENKECRHPDKE